MTSEVRAVVFDVDGTLYDYKTKSILPSSLKAIAALKAKGIRIVIASGRSYALLGEDFIRLVQPDYYVLANGHELLRGDGSPIRIKRFTREQVDRLAAIARKNNIHMMLKYNGFNCVYSGWEQMLSVFVGIGPLTDAFQYCPEGNYHLERLPLGITMKGSSHLRETLSSCGEDLRVEYFHDPAECDVFHRDTNKLVGLRYVLDQVGIPLENCVAFGDSGNDVDMLESVGYGVCMGNGSDNAKAAAKHVCGCSWEGGIFQSLAELNLISDEHT